MKNMMSETMGYTLWSLNIAMESHPFVDDLHMAIFAISNHQKVVILHLKIGGKPMGNNPLRSDLWIT